MKKLYWVICGKCRKLETAKVSYISEKALVLSIMNEDKKIFKEEEESIKILKILGLIENI